MKKVVVIGGQGHAKVCISMLKKLSEFCVLGYTALEASDEILGVPFLGGDDVLERIKKENPDCGAVIGVGSVKISSNRMDIKKRLDSLGFECPVIISPTAVVNEDVKIKEGTIIFDNVVINAGARIGQCAIINSNSTVEHDCEIGDFTHIAPGVTLSGNIKVGKNCLIGVGSAVLQNRCITDECLIAAGSAVVKDCLEPGTYIGVPARKKKL